MIVDYALQTIEQMRLHYGRLSAKERKRYAALEALKLGPGGVDYISYIFGVRKNTLKQAIKGMVTESGTPSISMRKRKSSSRKKNG